MSTTPVPPPDPAKGLPPVQAPSGRHIVQLFIVPGLIVAGAVTILLGFSWLAGGARTSDQFLKDIDNPNTDIRWRAANDLAQVLKRDDKLAANASFGLQLADRYQKSLDELDRLEQARASLPSGATSDEISTATKALVAQRNYTQYLGACLGNLSLPVGVQPLIDVARKGRGRDDKLRALLRRQAVWALANLGDSARRFEKLKPEEKQASMDQLRAEASSQNPITRAWADAALAYLTEGKSLGVLAALVDCSKEDRDVFLREQAAHAMIFWPGNPEEQKLAESALVILARDTGRGERIELKEGE